jgi:hypothetical protein
MFYENRERPSIRRFALYVGFCIGACGEPEPVTPQDSEEVTGLFTGDYLAHQASVRLFATEPQQHAGRVLAAGDIDGDGVDELVVTTVRDEDYEGGAWLLHSLPNGAGTFSEHGTRMEGDPSTRGAGRAASIGDVDADGLGDLLISAPYPGSNALMLLSGPIDQHVDLGNVTRRFVGDEGDTTGHDAQLLDMNGDGLADVISGAPGRFGTSDVGAVMLVYAPFDEGTTNLRTDADATLLGAKAGDGAGRTLAAGGDVDGDGAADLLIGAPYADREGEDRGVVHLVLGPFEGDIELSDARAELRGERPGDLAGMDLALADVDEDGLGDLIVGAPLEPTGGDNGGAVYIQLSGEASAERGGTRAGTQRR